MTFIRILNTTQRTITGLNTTDTYVSAEGQSSHIKVMLEVPMREIDSKMNLTDAITAPSRSGCSIRVVRWAFSLTTYVILVVSILQNFWKLKLLLTAAYHV